MYKIHSIFSSIQGEGFWTGQLMTFVRFSGCNLSCSWCDTKHKKVDMKLTVSELIERIGKFKSHHVYLTGGEPMLQVEDDLILRLRRNYYTIHIETNGTIRFNSTVPGLWITVSPKENWILKRGSELKVVWLGQTKHELDKYFESSFAYYYLQPCAPWLSIPPNSPLMEIRFNILLDIIKEEPRWRLSLRIQKLLGVR